MISTTRLQSYHYMLYLGSNHLSGGRLQDFALASRTFDSFSGRLGEGMSLYSNIFSGEFIASDNNLVDIVLGLGDGLGFQKGFD